MSNVICRDVMFGVIVGQVVAAFLPKDLELSLGIMAFKPIKLRVKRFELACYDGVVDISSCSRVVNLDCRIGLGPTHFNQCIPEWDHFFGCDIESTKFGFGGRCVEDLG